MIYLKKLNKHTGGIIPTLLFTQTYYWYRKMKRPFYKFLLPCSHPLCLDPDDTWTKELDVSRHSLNSAFKQVGTKLKRGQSYDLRQCGLILYWSGGNGMTFYIPNYPRLLSLDLENKFLEKHFSDFIDWKNSITESENRTFNVCFSPSRNWNFGLSYKQESTQKTIQKNTQKKTQDEKFPPSDNLAFDDSKKKESKEKNSGKKEKPVLPFDGDDFANLWTAWKGYKSDTHDFTYDTYSETAALLSLGNYTEEFATSLLIDAMSKGWKNFHFNNTPQKFSETKNTPNNAKYNFSNSKQSQNPINALFSKY